MPTWTGAVSTDWNTAGNWTSPSAVPTAATAAIFTGTPTRNCTTGTAARACLTLDTTGYLGTLEIGSSTTGTLAVSGNVTIGSSVGHITGLANLRLSATGNLDVATGVTIPNLECFANVTITLIRTIVVTNLTNNVALTTFTASSAMELRLTNGTIQIGGGHIVFNPNVTLSINNSCNLTGGSFLSGAIVQAAGSTFTLNSSFTIVTGSIFNTSAGTFIPNLNTITLNTACSINMGTNSFYNFSISTSLTVTMLSNIVITNNLILFGIINFNGAFDVTVGGNVNGGTIINSTSGRKVIVTATSTGTATLTQFSLNNFNLEINCLNRNIIFTAVSIYTNCTINYLATNTGGFTTTGHTLSYAGTSSFTGSSINMFGSTNSWNIISSNTSSTLTLLSNVYCVQFGPTLADTINGSGFFICATTTGALSTLLGNAGLRFIGASNGTWNQINTNSLAAISIEKTGGAILNIPNSFTYSGGTITSTSLINHTATLTLGNCTLNTSVASWNNITTNNNITVTINSLLTILGNLTLNGTTTFAGTSGWACANLLCSAISSIIVLQNSVTYTTTTSVNMLATAANPITMRSNTPTVLPRAIWTLNHTATQSIVYVNGQGVDSNAGQTVWTFGGNILTSLIPLNWNVGAKPSSYGFIGI